MDTMMADAPRPPEHRLPALERMVPISRQIWNDKYRFNVCVTSYTLASRDAHIFKRKPWYYMILDEAHMIKNFRSQRWNVLLMFRSFRRLLLTGTPLQNNVKGK